ncbi:MAG: heme-binding domain-containing protein [Flavobacteriaceae bacterium]|nr:heme-binding domain-containing protein [Flavobacteriaceae bacterium]
MKRILKYILLLVLAALVIMQFIRPDKNQGGYESIAAFEADTKPTKEVVGILQANCYDCHSAETQYPWYAEIAPFSYWLADHIKVGKHHFNVSEWESYLLKKRDHKLDELIEMVEKKEMPLDSYTWLHGDLTEEDSQLLLHWAQLVRLRYATELKVSSK